MKKAVSIFLLLTFLAQSASAAVDDKSREHLENILQSGIGTETIQVSNYSDELSLPAKITKFFPLFSSVNYDQAQIIRYKFSKYLFALQSDKVQVGNLQQSTFSPVVSATSYVVYDPTTDQILLEKNSSTVRSIASISKLFTAMVALESFPLDQKFTMTSAAKTVGSTSNISVGETFNLLDAVSYLLNQSANDVSNQIQLTHDAIYQGASFVDKMNYKAAYIGLYNTQFNNPSGLLPQNKSTAIELAKLIDYMKTDYPELLSLGRQKNILRRGTVLTSTNPIRDIAQWRGGKNGYISASGRTLAALFELPSGKEVIITILNSPTDQSLVSDTSTLLNSVN